MTFFSPEGLRELFRSLEHDDCSLFTAEQLDDVIKKLYLPCPSLWSVFFSIINFKRSTKCQLNVGNFKTKSNLCFFKCGKNLKMTSDTHTGIINIIMRFFCLLFKNPNSFSFHIHHLPVNGVFCFPFVSHVRYVPCLCINFNEFQRSQKVVSVVGFCETHQWIIMNNE